MFHKVKSVSALQNFRLSVQFCEGVTKLYDMNPLFEKMPFFAELKEDPELFYAVYVDVGGYGVVWNDELDLSADGLYEQGHPCQPPEDIEKHKQLLIETLVMARKNAKLSQKQLEILSGVAQPCIARMETGTTDPQLTTLLKILEPLGLTLSITNI